MKSLLNVCVRFSVLFGSLLSLWSVLGTLPPACVCACGGGSFHVLTDEQGVVHTHTISKREYECDVILLRFLLNEKKLTRAMKLDALEARSIINRQLEFYPII